MVRSNVPLFTLSTGATVDERMRDNNNNKRRKTEYGRCWVCIRVVTLAKLLKDGQTR